jgi:surface protein
MEFNNETIRIAVQLYVKNETEGEEKYGHINTWNVSGVTDMNNMFNGAVSFNQPLSNWNVSNVTSMCDMFDRANAFNQPLDNWNVSNVTNMCYMFACATSFNQPLNNWNVSNVIIRFNMFQNTPIGEMLIKHKLTEKQFFESPKNKKVYHELFDWPRKKDYVMFLVNNHYLPFNNHNGEHEYHPLFDNTDISKYIATYV